MTKSFVLLFPGQGAQYVGMGRDMYQTFSDAREIFDHADDILNRKLSKVIFEGSESELKETKNSQPAIFVVSLAILNVLNKQYKLPSPLATGGLSLGEYTALFAANVLPFEECLRLVQQRALFMHEACEATQGFMAAVLGLDDEKVRSLINGLHLPNDIWCANFNCPGQVVISGTKKGIEEAKKALLEGGAKRALDLEVHGAFHSGLMQPAEKKLSEALHEAHFTESSIPVAMNVTGECTTSTKLMKELLLRQLTSSVLWSSCVRSLDQKNPEYFIEVGCGTTLQGMNKRIAPCAATLSVEKPEHIDSLLQKLIS